MSKAFNYHRIIVLPIGCISEINCWHPTKFGNSTHVEVWLFQHGILKKKTSDHVFSISRIFVFRGLPISTFHDEVSIYPCTPGSNNISQFFSVNFLISMSHLCHTSFFQPNLYDKSLEK
ncbi:hypothetical protein RF11_00038 [Thelohanellus kitauei]|uniref:Uncharacterized protein n=1 Tax=Thelohanellus kitauei TaxID=669202 RepID=A0A0C2J8A9_THEKT|nr:hypothetical protein RF11_00038 [Thelohanellus kitauei]